MEYIALTHAAKEAIWLRYVLADILHADIASYPITLHCNNCSAIMLAKDNTYRVIDRKHWQSNKGKSRHKLCRVRVRGELN